MRAAVLRHGQVQVREVDDPTPGPGQVLVKSLACGICASDLHFMDHSEAGDEDDSGMSTYDQDVDIVMGHEYCAEVIDYGPSTQRVLKPGTRVSSLPVLPTATGMRIIGQNPDTPGGFGEYFLLSEHFLRAVETDLPSEAVAVSDAIAVGWSAAVRADLSPNDVPLILGCGAIGLSTIATLKHLGQGPIIAVDFLASRRATALAMGADIAIDPAEISPYQAWRDIAYDSPEQMRDLLMSGAPRSSVLFECVGLPGVLDAMIKGCERSSRIFSMGGPPEGDRLHTMTAKRKGLNIQFGGGPSPAHWDAAFYAVCNGDLDVTPMLGRSVALDEVPAALDAARDSNGPARIIVTPFA